MKAQVQSETYSTPALFELEICESLTGSSVSTELAANTVMSLSSCAIQFAAIERVPRYNEWSRENDAEHSFMLSLVATELAQQYYPDLNHGLVSQYGTVHDLVEIDTGDVATFDLDDADIANKEAHELAALENVASRLPSYTRSLLRDYESQQDPEARFVRLIDKLLPVAVDILGPGRKVMEEDYDVYTPEDLADSEKRLSERLRTKFPDPELAFLHGVRDVLADRFASAFEADDRQNRI